MFDKRQLEPELKLLSQYLSINLEKTAELLSHKGMVEIQIYGRTYVLMRAMDKKENK